MIVAEPTQNKAVTCHRGILTGTQEFFGLAGHSSEQRALTDNAIHKLTRWSDAALKVAESYNSKSFKDLQGIAFNLVKGANDSKYCVISLTFIIIDNLIRI